jgi:hypothetical protein
MVLEVIRTGGKKLKGWITRIRNRFEAELGATARLGVNGDRKQAKRAIEELKKALPGVLWSGTFSVRANDKLISHSGLLCADLDALGERLPEIRNKLQASPHVFALFLSPTGDGLKAVFKGPPDASRHLGSFRAIERHILDLTGIQIDEACKDVARLCFMSYDPELYVNRDAIEIEPLSEPEKPKALTNCVINLSERQRITTELLGNIEWVSETSGFCTCPGKHLHTTGDGKRDCRIDLDGVPTVHCFHNSCRGILDGVNHELRSRIGKAENAQNGSPHLRNSPNFIGNAANCVDVDAQSTCEINEPNELPPPPAPYVPPPLDLLPPELQNFVRTGARANDVEISFLFLPLLSEIAACIGISRSIRIKEGWAQPPILWTSVIAASGEGKDPAMQASIRPQLLHEFTFKRENDENTKKYKQRLAEWEATKKSERGERPEPPAIKTCLMDDATLEAIACRTNDNPRGILLAKAELSHWFGSFDQYRDRTGADLARWLQLYDGILFAMDRVTGNRSYRIANPRISIAAGVQPDTLRRILTDEYFERGLPARFLWGMPERNQPRRFNKKIIPAELFARVSRLLSRLRELKPHEDEENELLMPVFIPLSPAAERIFEDFYNEVGCIIDQSPPLMRAQWSKLIGGSARLALVGQLAHNPDSEEISGEIMEHACALARWFGSEDERIFSMLAETPEQREMRLFIEFVRRRGGSATVRDAMQNYWPARNDRDEAERLFNALVKKGLGKWEDSKPSGRGRPTRVFRLLLTSTSTQFGISRGKTENSVDVDTYRDQEITPTTPPDGEPAGVSVPLLIRRRMEAELLRRGLTQSAIDKLTPQQAHEILAAPAAPVASIVRDEFGVGRI